MSETDEGRSGAVDGAAPRSPARTEDVRERPQAPRSKAMRAPLILLLGLAPLVHQRQELGVVDVILETHRGGGRIARGRLVDARVRGGARPWVCPWVCDGERR